MNPEEAILRDASSRKGRHSKALETNYVSVEERTTGEMLTFVKKLSSQIQFYNNANLPDGDWSGLFAADLEELQAYIEAPENFTEDAKLDLLAKPHLVLMLTFLKLLKHPQKQFADLTRRHLDFYYKKALGLGKKAGIPDQVHLLFSISDELREFALREGTLMDGGVDSEGRDIYYRLINEVPLNRARVSQVHTVRVNKKYASLLEIRKRYEDGFMVALRWALGWKHQGDVFPPYHAGKIWDTPVDVEFLVGLPEKLADTDTTPDATYGLTVKEKAESYVQNQLHFLDLDNFLFCINTYKATLDPDQPYPSDDIWAVAIGFVEAAYQEKVRAEKALRFKEEHESGGFEVLLSYALGNPNPGDALPPMPSSGDNFQTLYENLQLDRDDIKFSLAARYVSEYLGLRPEDFIRIMYVNDPVNNATQADWDGIYKLLVSAEETLRKIGAADAGRTYTHNIKTLQDTTNPEGGFVERENLHVFGRDASITDSLNVSEYYSPGFAIASPLFLLKEGKRTIQLDVACLDLDFPMDDLKALIQKGELLFDIHLSGEEEWLVLDAVKDSEFVSVETDVIGEELIGTYKNDDLFLIAAVQSEGEFRSGQHILLNDGAIWQVHHFVDFQRVALSFRSKLEGTWAQKRLPSLELEEEGEELFDIQYFESSGEIGADSSADSAFYGATQAEAVFKEADQGSFIVWNDGAIFEIERLIGSGERAKVKELGVLPDYVAATPKKVGAITFKSASNVTRFEILGVDLDPESQTFFAEEDINRLLVFGDGLTLKIRYLVELEGAEEAAEDAVKEFKQALVDIETSRNVEVGAASNIIWKYSSYPGFRFRIELNRDRPAILPPASDAALPGLDPRFPALQVRLKNIIQNDGRKDYVDMPYEFLEDIRLRRVNLSVNVEGAEDLRLRNELQILAPDSPFEPFTNEPLPGNALYFSSDELSRKQLDSVNLRFKWEGLPKDLKEYYNAYTRSGLKDIESIDNNSFQGRVSLYQSRNWVTLEGSQNLFNVDDESVCNISLSQGFNIVAYHDLGLVDANESGNPQDDWRYFKLELESPDFQHKMYPLVLRAVAGSDRPDIKSLPVFEPYTPKIKWMTYDYSASTSIDPLLLVEDELHTFAHIHPAGSIDVSKTILKDDAERGPYLLPEFRDEGIFYMGLEDVEPGQTVSVLLQLLPGTGDVQAGRPVVRWFYQNADGWTQFDDHDILENRTEGMIVPGILRFRIPKDASSNGPVMPTGPLWISGRAKLNAAGASKIMDVRAQAALAEYVSGEDDVNHLSRPLPPETIQNFVEYEPSVDQVLQPYSSFGARMPEEDEAFYTRVSERLRHRGRAVNIQDYEKLVLENFPEIGFVKCLSYGEASGETTPGTTTVVVVPDISRTTPFLPLEPRVAPSVLGKIQTSLNEVSSAFAGVQVINPEYKEILFRLAVRFRAGFESGYYAQQLSEDIKKFMSPWAFEEEATVDFSNVIYQSLLIYFVERLEYVDYVAVVSLFERKEVEVGDERVYQRIADGIAQTERPEAILVSSPKHIVDIIETESFQENDYKGIGYMIIGLDFLLRGEDNETGN